MHELVICVFASGPNCLPESGRQLVASVDKNIGISDYKYFVYAGSEELKRAYEEAIQPSKCEVVVLSRDRYAIQYNRFLEQCKSKYRNIIYTHDDVLLDTPETYPRTMEIVGRQKNAGGVTYTNHQYTSTGHLIPCSVRIGLHSDRKQFPRVFECHEGDLKKLDYPKGPVQVYGPFSHFNLVSMEAMAKIGPCADWTPTPVLTDEDWSLESCLKGLTNIWIPDIKYRHPRPGIKRKADSLRNATEAHSKFLSKWGYSAEFTPDTARQIADKHPVLRRFTNRSFDWMYL